jgi:hypothetical protein
MTGPECQRTWQAEAAEDGRLSEADRASFERHVTTCETCEQAVVELELLRKIGDRLPAGPIAPFEHRRSRNELLRRANALTVRSPRVVPWRALAAIAAALAIAVVLALRFRAPEHGASAATAAEPHYELTTSNGAEWRALERGPAIRLAVTRGRFELSVARLKAGQRFVLVLPDGELEVQGTRFVVEVDGRRTLGVAVHDGRVALRVRERGQALVTLGPGESFAARPDGEPPLEASPPAPETLRGGTAPARTSAPPAPLAAVPESPGTNDAADAGSRTTSGADFALAMSAFSAGDYGRAEQLFSRFAAEHPADARVEDATFLQAVARSRRGDAVAAQALAREYLRRYPNGLRRIEAERLAE